MIVANYCEKSIQCSSKSHDNVSNKNDIFSSYSLQILPDYRREDESTNFEITIENNHIRIVMSKAYQIINPVAVRLISL